MRPTATAQSALRTPLNGILGTEARVRILRALTSAEGPISAGDVAHRASLRPSGVRIALAELVDVGIIEMIGGGSRRLVQIARRHPLAKALADFFAAEREYFERIMSRIQQAASAAFLPPVAHVWLEGSVATGRDRPGDPLMVGILAHDTSVETSVAALRNALAPVEAEEDVTIEVRPLTYADLETLTAAERAALTDVIPLVGVAPLSPLVQPSGARRNTRVHGDLDARALALGEAIARKLKSDPTLVVRARRTIARRLPRASARERQTLEEWDRILTTSSIPRLRRFLVDPGARATRLRQSLPFLNALSPSERDAIVRGDVERP
jgi:DNA-binding transcriptional ArsR family regulator